MRWRRAVGRRLAAWAAVLALVVLATGCQVHTQVEVDTNRDGSGTVEVVVTLDRAATQAVGDIGSQLQTSDLVAAGWTVSGPSTEPDGSTVLAATQSFNSLAEASTLVAEIAGTGPAAGRPFRLTITSHKTWWSVHTRLVGQVDLSCDLACFGDSALAKELGTPTGVDPGSVASQRRNFTFGISVALPGKVGHTNAASHSAAELTWAPPLGQRTVLSATTSYIETDHLVEALVIAGLAAAAAIGLLVSILVWRSRRRRRRQKAGRQRGAHRAVGPSPPLP